MELFPMLQKGRNFVVRTEI